MNGFLDFLTVVLFIPLGAIAVLGGISIYVMNREKRDKQFAAKMDRWRTPPAWLNFSDKTKSRIKMTITATIVLGLLAYYAYTGEIHYDPDEFKP